MSTRKGMDLPATCSVTLGSARVMGVLKSGLLQSSRSPRSSGVARLESTPGLAGPLHGGAGNEPLRGQASFQWPSCRHSGQGFVGGRG